MMRGLLDEYRFTRVENQRNDAASKLESEEALGQLDLNLISRS